MEETPYCKVLTYNVNTDMRVEMPNRATGVYDWENFRWRHRKQGVFDVIMQSGADVICLQELREESIMDLLAERKIMEKYFIDYGKTNGTDNAFYLATLVEKSKWQPSSKQVLWMSETLTPTEFWSDIHGGNGFGRMVLSTSYRAPAIPDPKKKSALQTMVENNSKSLVVINTHFGLPVGERLCEAENIANICKEYLDYQAVVCGDFNSFPDARGEDQEKIILDSKFQAAAPYCAAMETCDKEYGTILGTQISYPYDSWTDDQGRRHPNPGEMGGHLDHIYFSPELKIKERASLFCCGPYGYDPTAKRPMQPSDHLPLIATLYKC